MDAVGHDAHGCCARADKFGLSAGTAAVLGTGQIRETVSWLVSVSTRYCHAASGGRRHEAAL